MRVKITSNPTNREYWCYGRVGESFSFVERIFIAGKEKYRVDVSGLVASCALTRCNGDVDCAELLDA